MTGGRDEKMCAWGFKFKHYLTASSTDSIPNPDLQYNNCEAFYTVVKVKAGANTIICCGEVDAVAVNLVEEHYVEAPEVEDTECSYEPVSDIPDPWKPNVCFNFMDHLLAFIKSYVKKDDSRLVHLLEFSGEDVTCTRLPLDSEYAFLHSWYTQ
ncbi:decapping and exoribonuclease protein-like [Mya arenaria]|uniref:decapping and exoribonuclease protein-like n=1 Tax=Mya arenaria TaxID=6604 RepID=UPI0022DEF1BE|nr:decapping and exoribonuclease protein-like [Mya arenaria]